jgi:type I site-specific restriction-modification system R (restriction) subunit
MELIKIFERGNKMDEEIKGLLEEEIKEEIRSLSELDSGSKEKSAAIDDLAKLYKLKIEDTKVDFDYGEKYEARASDEQLKRDQLSEQMKDRYFRLGIEAAGILLPLMFYAIWMRRGFRFEETGTYTSTTFRGLFNRFKPTKK